MASKDLQATKFMMNVKNDMLERGLALSTVQNYMNQLVKLNECKSFNNFGFLKTDKDLIVEFLSQYEQGTKANYLSAICAGLSSLGIKETHLYKVIYKFYHDMLLETLGKIDEVDNNEMTEKEIQNWVEWDEVMAKWNELNNMVAKFKNERTLPNTTCWETLNKFVVLSLFALQPPRRNKDYQNMYIITKPLPADRELDTSKNYFDIPDRQFVFNDFKNKRYIGTQTFPISEELFEVLKVWLKFHPDLQGQGQKPGIIAMFVNRSRVMETSPNFITLLLNRVFGRKVGSSMLRKSFVNKEFGDVFKIEDEVMEKRKEIADKMAHNLQTQRNKYFKRKPKAEGEEIMTSEI